MKRSIVGIGIDAASRQLLETWIEQGHLPALGALRARSSRARLVGCDVYRAETSWTCLLTGCEPEETGYWTLTRFSPSDYRIEDIGAYDFTRYLPFYALGDSHRIAVFDLPQSRPVDAVNGLQVIAWGAHSPLAPAASRPAELLGEIERRFGRHPALLRDEATLWRPRELERLERDLHVGIRRRADICEHLIRNERWDLFLTAFGETHAAGHFFWHRSQPDHPLHAPLRPRDGDPVLRVYQEVDRAIARIEASLPADTYLVVFSQEGMEANSMDLPSTVFLPELLYRHSFPGSLGLGVSAGELGEVALPARAWVPAVWGTQGGLDSMRRAIRSRLPSLLSYRLDRLWGTSAEDVRRPCDAGALSYQPPMWYQHLWPRMKAFALPSFSEGYVRINVKGREANGIVDSGDYDRVCGELSAEISALADARSGEPIVREVRRTRQDPLDDAPNLPDADLIVRWMPQPTDTVDSRSWGRIGPLPYARSGSHTEEGFAWFAGPGIEHDIHLPDGRTTSLAPTLLAMLGAPIPEYMKERPLL